jgi:hypothetical protein
MNLIPYQMLPLQMLHKGPLACLRLQLPVRLLMHNCIGRLLTSLYVCSSSATML